MSPSIKEVRWAWPLDGLRKDSVGPKMTSGHMGRFDGPCSRYETAVMWLPKLPLPWLIGSMVVLPDVGRAIFSF